MNKESDQAPESPAATHSGPAFEAGVGGTMRRLLAECVGTFALTVVDAGGAIIGSMSSEVTPPARAAAAGLLIMAMSYALSNVSGAHFNPAVTLSFALRRVFPWRFVPGYWVGQLTGALAAALLLKAVFGSLAHLGATMPEYGAGPGVVMEVFLTFLLVTVILSTATRHKIVGPTAAVASGGTVALCALFSRPISGASMNPARSFGPALVSGYLTNAWIYLLGPLTGAVLAVAFVRMVHPRRHGEEQEAAEGETT